MSVRLPQRPRRLLWAGVAGWAGLTTLGAFLDDGSVGSRIAHDACRAVATVFFALAVGGGLVEYWQRREWQRRTQWIVFDLLNQAVRQIALLDSEVVQFVTSTVKDSEQESPAEGIFTLPWSPVRDRAVRAQQDALKASAALFVIQAGPGAKSGTTAPGDGPGGPPVSRLGVEARADRLWALALQLGEHVEDELGPRILTGVAKLHDAVRTFADPFPGSQLGSDAAFAAMALTLLWAPTVIEASGQVAILLSEAFLDAEGRVTDEVLRGRVKSSHDEGARLDIDTSKSLDERETFQTGLRAAEADITRIMAELTADLESVRQLIVSPDADENTAQDALDSIAKLRAGLDQVSEVIDGLE